MEAMETAIDESPYRSSNVPLTPNAPSLLEVNSASVRKRFAARRTLSDQEWAEFEEAGRRLHAMMQAVGVTEDQIVEDFQRMKQNERRQRNSRA